MTTSTSKKAAVSLCSSVIILLPSSSAVAVPGKQQSRLRNSVSRASPLLDRPSPFACSFVAVAVVAVVSLPHAAAAAIVDVVSVDLQLLPFPSSVPPASTAAVLLLLRLLSPTSRGPNPSSFLLFQSPLRPRRRSSLYPRREGLREELEKGNPRSSTPSCEVEESSSSCPFPARLPAAYFLLVRPSVQYTVHGTRTINLPFVFTRVLRSLLVSSLLPSLFVF